MGPNLCLLSFMEKSIGDNNTVEIDPSVYVDLGRFESLRVNGSILFDSKPETFQLMTRLLMNEQVRLFIFLPKNYT
jgi:hypothetical protein